MANHKGGHFGKILDIDLTSGNISTKEYDAELARKFLGGTGLATYYLYKEVPKGTDPMSPENLLIFSSGPLCGTECPGARLSVNFKSPVSGGYGCYVGAMAVIVIGVFFTVYKVLKAHYAVLKV